jgi:hypothetical protein
MYIKLKSANGSKEKTKRENYSALHYKLVKWHTHTSGRSKMLFFPCVKNVREKKTFAKESLQKGKAQ